MPCLAARRLIRGEYAVKFTRPAAGVFPAARRPKHTAGKPRLPRLCHATLILPAEPLTAGIISAVLLGAGTAMVYPAPIASVADHTHPSWRAQGLAVYRFWRDLGYAAGAVVAGLIAGAFGLSTTVLAGGVPSSSRAAGPSPWLAVGGPATTRPRGEVRPLVPDHGGQVIGSLTAVANPAVTLAVAMPGWQPGRLAVTV